MDHIGELGGLIKAIEYESGLANDQQFDFQKAHAEEKRK